MTSKSQKKPTSPPPVKISPLDPVATLSEVSDKLRLLLEKIKIFRVIDLCLHFPYRYEDYTRLTPIHELNAGTPAVFEGQICHSYARPSRRSLSLVVEVEDEFGKISLRFFRWYPSLRSKLAVGERVRCFGTPYRLRSLEVSHPQFKLLGDNPPPLPKYLSPIYSTTSGLTQDKLRGLIGVALDAVEGSPLLNYALPKPHPFTTMALPKALRAIHQVEDRSQVIPILSKKHPAMKTILLHDICANLIALRQLREKSKSKPAPLIPYSAQALAELSQRWPFKLTHAQKKAIDEIAQDIASGQAMLRLLQGDVGSGKTVVAAFVAYLCRLAGYQVAFMAPTEILCEQHLETFQQWFGLNDLCAELLTSSLTRKAREGVLTRIAGRQTDVVIGTHALFQNEVQFGRLGLIIIDEQQRFGVEHRLQLARNVQAETKEYFPHQLMMTATPIPRTMASAQLSVLDCSVLDELPAGRTEIKTSILPDSRREELLERVIAYVQQDKQVFWVSPRIEEGDEGQDLQSVNALAKTLQQRLSADQVGVVHGRLKAKQREKIVGDFRKKKFPVLVATTVVEVGVDIPNATLMIVEHCERLGLSQIHQLRGRVGRGSKTSHCILLYREPLSDISQERLRAAYSMDGFVLAKKDLELRGAGEFFGTEQSGAFNMRVGDLFRDEALLAHAQKMAGDLLKSRSPTVKKMLDIWVGDSPETVI